MLDTTSPTHRVIRFKAGRSHKTLLAILSGVMLTAAFPPVKTPWVAWLALVPLLIGLKGEPFRRAFRLGFITGLSHNVTLIYWVAIVMGKYGNLGFPWSLGPLFLLCLYLALFPALFGGLQGLARPVYLRPLFAAFLWVALEYLRSKALSGFPWCLLGTTQYENSLLIQLTDLTGVYGLSFLIVLTNTVLFHLLTLSPVKRQVRVGGYTFGTALLIILSLFYGHRRLDERPPGPDSAKSNQALRCVVIQPSIDQSVKWDPSFQGETLARYQRLTRSTYDFSPDLIVWPETAVPLFFQDGPALAKTIFSLVEESNAALIFGSPAYGRNGRQLRYYNRAYLLRPDIKTLQSYDKVHLVPFGEYVPLKGILGFINQLVPAAGDFAPGDRIAPMALKNGSAGILICFEAIFPEISRAMVRKGADVLVNLTNDAWFGVSSAPYQHLSMSVFRAVENRRPLIRAANTGISAIIDSRGRIMDRTDLFEEETLRTTLHLSDGNLTFYAHFGDMFAYLAVIMTLAGIISGLRKSGKKSDQSSVRSDQ
jgi:apolipoprotein N-acyltransferase